MNYFVAANVVILTIVMSIPYYTLYYNGWLGIILILIDPVFATRQFNLFTVGAEVAQANQGTASSWAVVIYFQVLYFITVIFAPLMQNLIFLFLWNRKLSYFEARNVLMWANIAGYWASLEIFTISSLSASAEIVGISNFFSDYLTGGDCSAAYPLFSQVLGAEGGYCLLITLVPGAGAYLGIPVAIYVGIVNGIILRACRVALRDREQILEAVPLEERYSWTYLERKTVGLLMPHTLEHHHVVDPEVERHAQMKKEKKEKREKKQEAASRWVVSMPQSPQQQQQMMMQPQMMMQTQPMMMPNAGYGGHAGYQQHFGSIPNTATSINTNNGKSTRYSVEI